MNLNELKAANLKWWDERGPLHVQSDFYGVSKLVEGASSLDSFEIDEFSLETAKTLVHLQCHIGTDTISWARRGLTTTGLDFSSASIEQAETLAQRCNVDIQWVISDVYEAPNALGATYDVVYTGKGAIYWLDDIERWASTVAQLLNPGGRLYLVEIHPFSWVLGANGWSIQNDYFASEPLIETSPAGSYAMPDAVTKANTTVEWQHSLGSIVTALSNAGLTIEWLHEFPFTVFQQTAELVRTADTTYVLPEGTPRIPLLFSISARKPTTNPDI